MLALILAAAVTGSACANPSIVSAGVQSVTADGGLNHYTIAISVENEGTVRQPGNLSQSLDVFQDATKVGQIGLLPLGPDQTQEVTYGFDRSAEAGVGTTHLRFTLDFNGGTGNDI